MKLKKQKVLDMTMTKSDFFSVKITPNWEGLFDCILRRGTPERVHNIELFLDEEIKEVICKRFGLVSDLKSSDPYFKLKREVAIQRFLGYDYVRCGLDDFEMSIKRLVTDDTALAKRETGREYIDEHKGPITNRQEFEQYTWPDPDNSGTRSLEWYQENLPDDMCIIGSGGFAHFAEYITWLMGYETLCYALFEDRHLVSDISNKLVEIYRKVIAKLLQFSRVKIIWGSDDMGFRGGPLISPDDLREFVFPGHKLMAQMSHDSGRPYLLHSCGRLDLIIDELIDWVKIDARHSFEDTIEDVISVHKKYGQRIAHLGGIDVDFLCRSSEEEIRARVRHTLDECLEGGGYCLGTGNSVANYIPVDNYLIMMDEGRNYGGKL